MQTNSAQNPSTNPAEELATKPIRWSISAVAIALVTSLALGTLVNSVHDLKFEYSQIISSQQDQLAVVANSRRSTEKPVNPLVNQAPKDSNRVIVKYKEKDLPPGLAIAAERANLEKAQGLRKLLTISGINAVVYEVAENDTAQEVVDRILSTKKDVIEYAEVDMIVFPSYMPNDPYMTDLVSWHHTKISSQVAWDTTQGAGATIAILDTGTNCDHSDLSLNCVPGWNVYSNTNITTDINGHGTLTAGNAAAVGDNASGGAGVAYKAKIMPIRISDSADGLSSCSAIANGVIYAADHGAKVASNSYLVTGCLVTNDAAAYMFNKGGLYVRAMGNNGALVSTANDSNIIHVGATDQNDVKTSWSNYGPQVNVVAPGIGVYCTTVSGGYGSCWGTSFSVPIVSGVLGLMYSANPSLSSTQAKSILLSTADDLGEPGWDQYYGYGRVNAAKAVAAAKAAVGTRDAIAPSAPGNLKAASVSSNAIALTWTASTDDNSGVAGYSIYRNGTKLTTIAGTSYTSIGLTPLTAYSYTVKAEDVAGNVSVDSNKLDVTTPDVAFGISSYSVPTKTAITATITANLTKLGTVVVKYGTTAANLASTASSATAATTHTLSLSGLNAFTTYYYQVVATDATGTVVTSAVSSFKTNKASGGGKPQR